MLARLYKSVRFWGLLGTAVGLYVFFFVILGKIDMTWAMPDTDRLARNIINVWPQMPFFVQKQQTDQGEVVTYTVSTHQFTQAELRQMGVTNAVTQPAKPR
ncbi:MAG TPA: hypothetical protein VHY09_13595 [Candidatus Methylacidiphilales bacterium]|jgi:hypothetical protein|nr:hypothetical protein [Candidatus Methylacidiphilales bacterium]